MGPAISSSERPLSVSKKASNANLAPSFTDLLQSDSQTRAFEELGDHLSVEVAMRAGAWGEPAFKEVIDGAQMRFGSVLKGAQLRAKKLPESRLSQMLQLDLMTTESIASAHIAYVAGRFDPSAPTLAWAATPIMLGSRGDLSLLRYLIAAGADPNARANRGAALSYLVAREREPAGHPPGARLLLEAGADPHTPDVDGETPLFQLCAFWKVEPAIADLIRDLRARGASIHTKSKTGDTPLAFLKRGLPEFGDEPPESLDLRRQLITEFERDDLDDLLPLGRPGEGADIDGRRL